MPPSEITPTSVVPPPMSTTIEPVARDRQAGADRRGHRFLDQVDSDAPAPSADSRIARRSTWVEPQGTQMMMRGLGLSTGAVHHLDELLEHLLGDGEVGDHAVLHRADGLDVAGHLARAWPWPRRRRPGWSSCRWARLRGGWPRPRARRARCPCRARRSACWRCRGRWRGPWRNSDGISKHGSGRGLPACGGIGRNREGRGGSPRPERRPGRWAGDG